MHRLKRNMALFTALLTLAVCASCGASPEDPVNIGPEVSRMKAICELAVMDCYYHNVAKFREEDAEGILFWKKDKNFWIEYSGVVRIGVDVAAVSIEVADTQVTVTLPPTKVLDCEVDSASLSKESFIVAKDSASIDASDEIEAFGQAQAALENTAASDTALLAEAQQRTQALLEDYVTNIGDAVGKQYTITWVYLDAEDVQEGTAEHD